MDRKFPAYLLIVLFIYIGCTGNKVIKDYKRFAAIYVDILIAEEKNKGNFEAIANERKNVYARYGVNDEQFKATILYYGQNNERWGEFFSEVNKRIQELKKNQGKKSV